MEDTKIEDILKNQLELLSECSKHCENNNLADITLAMLEVCRYLEPNLI